MKKSVIIVAGGSGLRMGGDVPKQFLVLGDRPVLMHTIEAFRQFDSEMKIVLVLPVEHQEYWAELCGRYQFNNQVEIADGGQTRFHSVKNGLERITDRSLVGVHDGVRPFVSFVTLKRCYDMAQEKGNAVPVIDAVESIRKVSGERNIAVNRQEYKLVQTPQVFLSNEIIASYQVPYKEEFTDDASVLENSGQIINLVEGNRENIKITSPIDLQIGELYLSKLHSLRSF